jgi:hypothetical protein
MSKTKLFLFILGTFGITLSGVWWSREGGYEPLLTFICGVAALIEDFFAPTRTVIAHVSIKRKSKDDLRKILDGLGVSCTKNVSKNELIKKINKSQKSRMRQELKWHWSKWLTLSFAVILVPCISKILGIVSPLPTQTPPSIELMYYEKTKSGLKLVDSNEIEISLEPEDIINQRVQFPLQIAVRNRDKVPLKVVRVELSYPKELNVISTGNAKIDPKEHLLIYEHEIGTLENIGYFTPLKTIDIVSVPFHFMVDSFVMQTRDGVPHWMVTIIGVEGLITEKIVVLGVRVFCEGRPPAEGMVRLRLAGKVQIFTDFDNSNLTDLTEEDKRFFREGLLGSQELDQWESKITPSGDVIGYSKVSLERRVAQYITVNKTLRKLIVDDNSDGWLDFTLIDENGDGEADLKVIFNRWPMIDWKKKGVE